MKHSIATILNRIRAKTNKVLVAAAALALPAGMALSSGTAYAVTQVIVTPTNQQGWSTADTRPGGAVNFVVDPTAPGSPHRGALQLTTDATTTAKAQYLRATNTPLSHVNDLSYYTKQNSALFAGGAPAYQLVVCLTGANPHGCNPSSAQVPASSFSTLVFEPYQNPGNNGNATVVNGDWQKWDVDAGLFWSTRTVVCPAGTVAGTPGGPATYTLAAIKTMCPQATVIGFGVNIGTNNPGYDVETDLFNFNGTVYNFEPAVHRVTVE